MLRMYACAYKQSVNYDWCNIPNKNVGKNIANGFPLPGNLEEFVKLSVQTKLINYSTHGVNIHQITFINRINNTDCILAIY